MREKMLIMCSLLQSYQSITYNIGRQYSRGIERDQGLSKALLGPIAGLSTTVER
jgi:hypothetical protein